MRRAKLNDVDLPAIPDANYDSAYVKPLWVSSSAALMGVDNAT